MFTPEERKQVTALLNLGYTDAFRYKYPEKRSYTWWSYMSDLRERDVGWRIDYFFVSESLKPLIQDVFSQREVLGSDHGPLVMVLNKDIVIKERPVYLKKETQPILF